MNAAFIVLVAAGPLRGLASDAGSGEHDTLVRRERALPARVELAPDVPFVEDPAPPAYAVVTANGGQLLTVQQRQRHADGATSASAEQSSADAEPSSTTGLGSTWTTTLPTTSAPTITTTTPSPGYPAPIDCVWSEWEAYGPCTRSCGCGTQRRERYVRTYPQNSGKDCDGSHFEIRRCNTELCPEEHADHQPWQAGTEEPRSRIATTPAPHHKRTTPAPHHKRTVVSHSHARKREHSTRNEERGHHGKHAVVKSAGHHRKRTTTTTTTFWFENLDTSTTTTTTENSTDMLPSKRDKRHRESGSRFSTRPAALPFLLALLFSVGLGL